MRGEVAAAIAWAVLAASTALAQPKGPENWRDLGPKQRYDALQNYWQHERLPADRQRDVEQRYERWQNMSPDERDRVRENYQRYQKLPPTEQERFQRRYQKWRQQSPPPD